MRHFSIILAIAAVSVSGCATSPVSSSSAPDVPPQRIINSSLTTPFQGAALLVVTRDRGLMGSACNSRVFIDGQPIADLAPGERVVAYVLEGEHVVGATATGICGGGTAETGAAVKAGQSKAYRISSGQGGDYAISATAF
jgi:hypothetical protein